MLKRRLVPVLYIKNGLIVRSEDFRVHQNIGNIINEAERYNEWDIDELIYVDISRDRHYDMGRDDHGVKSYNSIEEIIDRISRVCFMPLTFGGGVRNLQDVDVRIQSGADKIIINSGAIHSPKLVEKTAEKYGAQCVVISIDYRIIEKVPVVFSDFGTKQTEWTVEAWIGKTSKLGAGEIFLNSIERDGRANGFDIKTIKRIGHSTSLPLIACGGAGDPYDFLDLAEQTTVSALAAGNIFHFKERAYPRIKKLLKSKHGHSFR
ncbi:HisA/HisF-related TIM barrel protein [Opitutales bacterium]|nr:HisA/HisF-related TIM barrel protein [Opitutales bacterium]